MNQAVLVVGSFVLGAIVDHFLEVRSIATLKRAIKESEDRVIAAVGSKSSKSAKAGE